MKSKFKARVRSPAPRLDMVIPSRGIGRVSRDPCCLLEHHKTTIPGWPVAWTGPHHPGPISCSLPELSRGCFPLNLIDSVCLHVDCLCLSLHVFVCVCAHVHTHTCTFLSVYICALLSVCAPMCDCVHTCVYACAHAHTRVGGVHQNSQLSSASC